MVISTCVVVSHSLAVVMLPLLIILHYESGWRDK